MKAISVGLQSSSCGYCKAGGDECSIAEGAVVYEMSPDEYQRLVDMRWRRSGTYLYRPVLELTCCPLQTIRYVPGISTL